MSALRALRVLGLLEGGSLLLLLCVAMPLKYFCHWPLAVRAVGGIHGLLFLLFLASVYRCASELRWPARHALFACAAALLPGGPWLLNRWLDRRADSALQ
jgi:integral membrane protein